MKTHVRHTSLSTHHTNEREGTYDRTIEMIVDFIRSHEGATMNEIAAGTGLKINQVSGRCNELKKQDRIAEGETVETTPGHYTHRLYTVKASTAIKSDNDSRYEAVRFARLADGQSVFLA